MTVAVSTDIEESSACGIHVDKRLSKLDGKRCSTLLAARRLLDVGLQARDFVQCLTSLALDTDAQDGELEELDTVQLNRRERHHSATLRGFTWHVDLRFLLLVFHRSTAFISFIRARALFVICINITPLRRSWNHLNVAFLRFWLGFLCILRLIFSSWGGCLNLGCLSLCLLGKLVNVLCKVVQVAHESHMLLLRGFLTEEFLHRLRILRLDIVELDTEVL
ncbi:hypothetical protein HG531_010087 [Fusarium graminearum]|nr:hypothetical protein HG531_010087 [Fusarium graminearum]